MEGKFTFEPQQVHTLTSVATDSGPRGRRRNAGSIRAAFGPGTALRLLAKDLYHTAHTKSCLGWYWVRMGAHKRRTCAACSTKIDAGWRLANVSMGQSTVAGKQIPPHAVSDQWCPQCLNRAAKPDGGGQALHFVQDDATTSDPTLASVAATLGLSRTQKVGLVEQDGESRGRSRSAARVVSAAAAVPSSAAAAAASSSSSSSSSTPIVDLTGGDGIERESERLEGENERRNFDWLELDPSEDEDDDRVSLDEEGDAQAYENLGDEDWAM